MTKDGKIDLTWMQEVLHALHKLCIVLSDDIVLKVLDFSPPLCQLQLQDIQWGTFQ